MGWAFWVVAGASLAMTAVAGVLAGRLAAARRREAAARANLIDQQRHLERQLHALERRLGAVEHPAHAEDPDHPDYVITRIGRPESAAPAQGRRVPDQVLFSATFGEPLVKVLAFGHGLRRALSAESRNRIGFEVRREVRRSRKLRRREMRDAWRQLKAEGRSGGLRPEPAEEPRGDVA